MQPAFKQAPRDFKASAGSMDLRSVLPSGPKLITPGVQIFRTYNYLFVDNLIVACAQCHLSFFHDYHCVDVHFCSDTTVSETWNRCHHFVYHHIRVVKSFRPCAQVVNILRNDVIASNPSGSYSTSIDTLNEEFKIEPLFRLSFSAFPAFR